ncbi:retrovirus-related pol polyprotein from transposon TNT 1-94 [Tanacetum coccineum]|uniref:Retrovirus-related pol polyprotein from transposon TNT 1-94 n=1 Tax=Tanacetum coccineum TaxID=301880 RepID=A0ABQ5DQT7_9ASTR
MEKEAKNIDTKIALEKKVKELDNIVCKMGQSAQTVHMLKKPQVLYDNNLKQALGFQNPFYLKKAQQIRPMLYDSNVFAKETNVISIADSKETLMLEKENFGKRFVLQQELSDEQALHPIIDKSASSSVKIEAPQELPNLSLVNTSLKKLKYHLGQFDNVVKADNTQCFNRRGMGCHATTMAPGMYKLDPIILAHQAKNNKETHEYYLKHTMEQVVILREHPVKGAQAFCSVCNTCLFDANHAMCLIDHVNSMNVHDKSAFKKIKKRKEWKPTRKVFNSVGYKWKPAGRTFTLVGNACPLTRITATNKVPLRVPIPLDVVAPEHVVTRLYTRRPKVPKFVPNSKPKAAKSMTANRMEPDTSRGSDTSVAPSSSSLIDCRLSKLFCDLEVAFKKHTCFVRNLEGVDLLSVSQGTNMYSLSIRDMMTSSPICLLSKATKTKSWLWHQRLSYLNFGALNHLARNSLVCGLPRLKFEKDHLCYACAMGKNKKQSLKPKSKDTNQEKLYLLHMDLCGPMRVVSVNGKKYILVIVDDYSQFTWVKFLASKDEAPNFIIKFLKMIQVRLNVAIRNIYTNNATEFVNQTLREYYEQLIYIYGPK